VIGAVIALGLVAVLLAGALVLALRLQAGERREWVMERRSLVDRVIAQHTGEVIALDRNQRPPRERIEQPQAVGLG
jgi:hypothetical protein